MGDKDGNHVESKSEVFSANFIQAFQVDGEGKFVDGSIRSNACLYQKSFRQPKTSSAKALGLSYVDIREKLGGHKFKDVEHVPRRCVQGGTSKSSIQRGYAS